MTFYSRFKQLAEIIIQIATRIFFVMGSTLMAAAVVPMSLQAVALPVVAVGTATLAAFFFPQSDSIDPPYFESLPPLIRPIQKLPPGAPRGLENAGNNCAFNATIQFLESIPPVADWLRHPLTPEIDMAAFQNFIAGYDPHPEWVADFVSYATAQLGSHRPIPTVFTEFLNAYRPRSNPGAFGNFKETYEHILLLQGVFTPLLAAYDRAVRENLPFASVASGADSQTLRLALNQFCLDVKDTPGQQTDAAEILTAILDVLPNHLKIYIERSCHLNVDGLAPPVTPMLPKRERTALLPLSFKEDDPTPTLDRMVQNSMDDHHLYPYKADGTDGVKHEYTIARSTIRLLEAPPFLIFHIKRFMRDPSSTAVKRNDPIEFPSEKEIVLPNGEMRRYRLVSFIHHRGGYERGGHYTTDRIVGEQRYLISDASVILEDPPTWKVRLQHAYLLCYLPVA